MNTRGVLLCRLFINVALVLLCEPAIAQRFKQDTSYVRDHSDRVTLRLYASHKFNSMVINAADPFTDVRYRPNGQVNIGVGASLRKFTLNIGVRAPFVNDDVERKGKTRFLDAQANLYGTKQASNLFLQVYKGYHITSHTKALLGWEGPTELPYRPDLLQYNIGLSSLRIVNHERFSYRAAFNQDAVQLRSQGSWLIGGYLTAFVVRADSALVPSRLQERFPAGNRISRATYFDLGPMGGYAYTHVFRKHWFVTASGALGGGLSVQAFRIEDVDALRASRRVGLGWHTQLRAAAGYNSRLRYVGMVFSQEHIAYVQREEQRFGWDVGVVRLVFAQRFRDRPQAMDRGTRWLQRKKQEVIP